MTRWLCSHPAHIEMKTALLSRKEKKQTGKKHNKAMTTTTEASKHTSTKKTKQKKTNKQTD